MTTERTLVQIIMLSFCFINLCHAHCNLTLKNIRVITDRKIICGQVSMTLDQQEEETDFSWLKVFVAGRAGTKSFFVEMTNDICQEDFLFVPRKRHTVHICGTIPEDIQTLEPFYVTKATLTAQHKQRNGSECVMDLERPTSFLYHKWAGEVCQERKPQCKSYYKLCCSQSGCRPITNKPYVLVARFSWCNQTRLSVSSFTSSSLEMWCLSRCNMTVVTDLP